MSNKVVPLKNLPGALHPSTVAPRVISPFENRWAPPRWHVLSQLLVGLTLFPIRLLVIFIAFVLIAFPTTLVAGIFLPTEKLGEGKVEPGGRALRICMLPVRCAALGSCCHLPGDRPNLCSDCYAPRVHVCARTGSHWFTSAPGLAYIYARTGHICSGTGRTAMPGPLICSLRSPRTFPRPIRWLLQFRFADDSLVLRILVDTRHAPPGTPLPICLHLRQHWPKSPPDWQRLRGDSPSSTPGLTLLRPSCAKLGHICAGTRSPTSALGLDRPRLRRDWAGRLQEVVLGAHHHAEPHRPGRDVLVRSALSIAQRAKGIRHRRAHAPQPSNSTRPAQLSAYVSTRSGGRILIAASADVGQSSYYSRACRGRVKRDCRRHQRTSAGRAALRTARYRWHAACSIQR
jgi:hypothetical protein